MRALLALALVLAACSSTTENEGGANTGGVSGGAGAGGASSGGTGTGGASSGGASSGGSAGTAAGGGGGVVPPADASSSDAAGACELSGSCQGAIKTKGCGVAYNACWLSQECKCAAVCLLACGDVGSGCLAKCGGDLSVGDTSKVKAFVTCMAGC